MFADLLPAIAAALVACAAGGSVAGLARPIRWWPLGLLAIAVELVLARVPVAQQPWLGTWGHWVWAASLAGVLLVLLRNALQRGLRSLPWSVSALGVGLNLVVVLANGGYMPVTQSGLDQTGQSAELSNRTAFRRDVPVDDTTRLAWLADVIVDPAWVPHPTVSSVGDRLLALGLAGWAFASVYGTPRGRKPRLSGGAADLFPD